MDPTIELTPFDAAEYLTEPEDQAELLSGSLYITCAAEARHCQGDWHCRPRAWGEKRELAAPGSSASGSTVRLAQTDPTLETMLKVLPALGLKMRIEAAA
jgi:hypothetical protein